MHRDMWAERAAKLLEKVERAEIAPRYPWPEYPEQPNDARGDRRE